MPKRKTFSIAKLLHSVNKKNAESTCSAEVRQGWNSLLSDILMQADVYAGYNYLGPEDLPEGELPGIAFETSDGSPLTANEFYERLDVAKSEFEVRFTYPKNGDKRVYPDETRRFYYVDASFCEEYGKLDREKALVLAGGAE